MNHVIDHRDLGRELAIFTGAELVGAGLPLWLPHGAAIVAELERYITEVERQCGYQHVRTPLLAKRELYDISGHWKHFSDDMFPAMSVGGDELVLRPSICPHHALVYCSQLRSYRDLPLRIAEFGPMYRRERSGVLGGLTRVRAITLNDAHHFCAPDQVVDEVLLGFRLIEDAYAVLGIKAARVRLSVRGSEDKYAGDDESWARAELWLRTALDQQRIAHDVAPGEAAFYGPKIDVQVLDAHSRELTLSTVQVDLHQPRQFGLEYVRADGGRDMPIMVHRSVLSSMERMVAYLLESYAGALPAWLSPVQVAALPVTDDQLAAAQELVDVCQERGVRAELDARSESLAARVRTAQLAKVPYVAVVGPREAASGLVSIRCRDGRRLEPQLREEAADRIAAVVSARQAALWSD